MSNNDEKDKKNNDIKKVSVRLLKVVYSCFLFIIILLSFFVLWNFKPVQVIDYVEINCANGKSYNSDEQEIYLFSEYVSELDNNKIRYLCGVNLTNKETGKTIEVSKDKIQQAKELFGVTDLDIQRILLDDSDKKSKNYSLIFKYRTEGSWSEGIGYASLVFVVGIIILEIVKRTVRYIFIGKSFFS